MLASRRSLPIGKKLLASEGEPDVYYHLLLILVSVSVFVTVAALG